MSPVTWFPMDTESLKSGYNSELNCRTSGGNGLNGSGSTISLTLPGRHHHNRDRNRHQHRSNRFVHLNETMAELIRDMHCFLSI